MNLDYINDHSVVDRYILGQLSEQEQVEFELYFLEHPEILDEVELARSLKRGLTAHQATLAEPGTATEVEHKSSLFDGLRGWFQSPAILTANFAIMAALLVLVFLPRGEPSPPAFTADRAWIGQVRGEDAPLRITLRSASLVLDIDVDEAGPYRVTLLDGEGRSVREIEGVEASSDALLVVLKTAGISSGRYTLRVTGPRNAPAIQRELQLIVSR